MIQEGQDYQFTSDWFHWAPEVWQHIKTVLPSNKHFLEIGAYEGRSTVWTVENMLHEEGVITVIDTWQGGYEHKAAGDDMAAVEKRFNHNIKLVSTKRPQCTIISMKNTSTDALAMLHTDRIKYHKNMPHFDFIFIDGSHVAKDVLTDACMAWPLLKAGGVMVFDDYMWGDPIDVINRPKTAIDTFTTLFGGELSFIHIGYQLVVKKHG